LDRKQRELLEPLLGLEEYTDVKERLESAGRTLAKEFEEMRQTVDEEFKSGCLESRYFNRVFERMLQAQDCSSSDSRWAEINPCLENVYKELRGLSSFTQ
jgi:hypothetical protein